MANIKSAKKRILISERNRQRNRTYKSTVRTLIKKYLKAIDVYSAEPTPESLAEVHQAMSTAYSKIDKAVKCNVFHPNNGARKKARLVRALKRATSAAS
ncbi:ribosomal protein S20 [Rubidibacter lacunae KORDI 51-2]|uniref:Small ribosomal subunit protein bS20 n=1 Tax=Rubidibacter lacunae KORDI 51-2 TaxID=582515 RepID=U5D593_9CHRO|nr:30S ribosomal protein S20 [Rubidibacter lacunae]ERN39853.1 ribosomal protein S20 [Rubidibacter lacunae KORDI 51-2]